MRSIRILVCLAVLCALSGLAQERGSQRLATIPLRLPNGTVLTVEVARTPQEHQTGLMFRRHIPDQTGMLFIFPSDEEQTFWMKNTLTPLDIIFVGSNRRITSISASVPATTPETRDDIIPRRSGRARYVLELSAGSAARYRLKTGDLLQFKP